MGDSRTSRSGNILVGVLILHTHKRLRRTVARMNTRSGNMLVGVLFLHSQSPVLLGGAERPYLRLELSIHPRYRATEPLVSVKNKDIN